MNEESYQEFLEREEGPVSDAWEPQSDGACDWALMKIATAESIVEARKRERQQMMEKWDRYVEAAEREALHTKAFYAGKLEGYLRRQLEAGALGRRKSLALPSGTLQFRHVEAKYEVADKAAVDAWASEHDYVKLRVEPDLTKLKQICADGHEVPGMALVRQAGELFSINLAKEDKAGEA